jgi:hypothetical protein
MSAAIYACYDENLVSMWSRAHVVAAPQSTATIVPGGVKRHFIDATAHRRVPEVLLT